MTAIKIDEDNLEHKKTIVVIDDEVMIRKIAQKALEKTFNVHVVAEPKDLIKTCEEVLPDVILIDFIMPSIDGFELIKLLKSHSRLCDIPIINMSATDDPEFRSRAREHGASGFILKPLRPKSLAEDITLVLDSISNSIISKNNLLEFIICYNNIEKEKKIIDILRSLQKDEEKAILLTWTRGEVLYENNPFINEMIDKNDLILLEIKPNLITKFPYLQDLTPILIDIEEFLDVDTRKYTLVFDEPRNLLSSQNKTKSMAQAYSVERIFYSSFQKVFYVNSKSHSEEDNQFINKIGNILTGAKS